MTRPTPTGRKPGGTALVATTAGAAERALPAALLIDDALAILDGAPGALQPLRDPVAAYLDSLSPRSQQVVRERLRAVARIAGVPPNEMPWHRLRAPHVEHIRNRLVRDGKAPASVNLTLAALRGVLRQARTYNLLTAEEYRQIAEVKPARGSRLPAGRDVSMKELRALVAACQEDDTPAGVRDAAILAVLYVGGLRRAEVAALALADYTRRPPTLRIRAGKGNKERLVPLTADAAAALDAWLALRGDGAGYLFVPINKGGRVGGNEASPTDRRGRRRQAYPVGDVGLTPQAIYGTLTKRAGEAGIDPLSPHDLRRTFVGDLLDAGVDLSGAQALAGHASPVTTARYDRRGEATKRANVERLHFPYRDAPRQG